ncbi:MAG TPA: RNA polymerase subunit sigma-24 [Treponema sp.]|nr:MAG: hypothetical protein A2001_16485 [Treponema sp. GWC1_61_84]HCM27439.1 RNA polymerase subunit sigma-24 [Treponema sp.]
MVAALEKWPETSIPDKPGAWLMTVARNRALDRLRRDKRLRRKLEEYGRERGEALEIYSPEIDPAQDRGIDDDLLSLVFTTCHPILDADARVALALKVLGGLSTAEIARAYLAQEATIAQRIVRAKRTLSEAKVPFLTPFVALMEIQASRLPARSGPDGEPILLLDQNRSRWDRLLIGRGLAALEKAERAAAGPVPVALGPYALQAEIAACHARALKAAETDWGKIAALYDALSLAQPSPVVDLNRAVAVAMAYGPAAGLELVDALLQDPLLENYHLLPSVRGDLLFKIGRMAEAAAEFRRASALTRNARERSLLLERAAASSSAVSDQDKK